MLLTSLANTALVPSPVGHSQGQIASSAEIFQGVPDVVVPGKRRSLEFSVAGEKRGLLLLQTAFNPSSSPPPHGRQAFARLKLALALLCPCLGLLPRFSPTVTSGNPLLT